MKKILFILLLPLMFACSSDDNEPTIPEGEKIAVTASEVVGNWEYIDEKEGITNRLHFQDDEIKGTHYRYRENKPLVFNDFEYAIKGLTISVMGSKPSDVYKTEIYKRGDKLYFLDMPFAPYTKE